MAAIMATNPVKGNFPHGFSFRHGDVNLSKASGSTWMNPVANITPAAKALMMKKIGFSGCNDGIVFPRIGMQTPTAPATRMEAIAPSLYFRASLLLPPSSSASHVHSAEARAGSKRRMQKKERRSFF